jgi:hypothetical protein
MRFLLLLGCLSLVFAGTETKPKVEDYDAHTQVKNLAVGAACAGLPGGGGGALSS